MDGHSNGLTKTKSEDQHSPLNDAGLDEIKKKCCMFDFTEETLYYPRETKSVR